MEALVVEGALVDLATAAHDRTALHIACNAGQEAAVNALLRAGAAADLAMADGTTPLMAAVIRGHADIARALVAAGASPVARATPSEDAFAGERWAIGVERSAAEMALAFDAINYDDEPDWDNAAMRKALAAAML